MEGSGSQIRKEEKKRNQLLFFYSKVDINYNQLKDY